MLRSPHDRAILAFAGPALGALAAEPLVLLVDTAFVSWLGPVPLAAVGVDAALLSLAFVVFNFLAYGTTPLIADARGRGALDEAGRLAEQALVLAAGIGMVGLVTLLALAGPAVSLMGATGELYDPAVTYLRIRALGAPALLLITAGHGIFRGHEDAVTPMWVTVALSAVNLVLDPLLMFGLGWGLAGAAWASAAAQWVGALGFLGVLARRRTALGIGPRWPAWRELLGLLGVGSVLSVRTFALVGTMAAATAVATRLGVAQIAAHQVAVQLWFALALLLDALAVAGQSLVANHLGAGRPDTAREVGDRLLFLGAVAGLGLAGGLGLLSPLVPRVFTAGPEVEAALRSVLPVVIVLQPLNALVFVWDGLLLALRAFRYVALAMVLSAAPAVALLLSVQPLDLGLRGVWAALALLIALRAVTAGWRWWGPSGLPRSVSGSSL